MKRIIRIFFFLTLIVNLKSKGQNIDTIISKVFFDAPLQKPDSQLTNYFHSVRLLKRISDTLETRFNLSNEKDLNLVSFKFNKHSLFSFPFLYGKIRCVGLHSLPSFGFLQKSLILFFESKKSQDSAFFALCRLLITSSFTTETYNENNSTFNNRTYSNTGKLGNIEISKITTDSVRLINIYISPS